jgi:hypothetical protein
LFNSRLDVLNLIGANLDLIVEGPDLLIDIHISEHLLNEFLNINDPKPNQNYDVPVCNLDKPFEVLLYYSPQFIRLYG